MLCRCPELGALAGDVRAFAKMMAKLDGHLLDEWIAAACDSGLSLPYGSGAVEGNVNRIKMLERQMYGRA